MPHKTIPYSLLLSFSFTSSLSLSFSTPLSNTLVRQSLSSFYSFFLLICLIDSFITPPTYYLLPLYDLTLHHLSHYCILIPTPNTNPSPNPN